MFLFYYTKTFSIEHYIISVSCIKHFNKYFDQQEFNN